MQINPPPTDLIQFDHRIRDEWVVAEGALWIDEEGIYKTRVTGVFLDGVNVTGLLTDYDLSEIDSAIEDAWREENQNTDPGLNPHPSR
jgi:hypothetical protein